MDTKDYTLTCGEVIDNLLAMADAYEKASAGKAPNGFAFNPTDAAANMKAAVHFIIGFGKQIPGWIPVSERLPPKPASEWDDSVAVLAWSKSNGTGIAHCVFDEDYGNRWQWECVGNPSHWMPLPEPPEVTA